MSDVQGDPQNHDGSAKLGHYQESKDSGVFKGGRNPHADILPLAERVGGTEEEAAETAEGDEE